MTNEQTQHANPYAASDAELPDMPTDAEIADAVSVHDRHPLLSKAVGHYFAHYARRWHLDTPGGGMPRPWHWPALLFDFYWLMYRKMYLASFLYLGITFVIGAATALLPIPEWVALAALLALKLGLCVSANALYRWHCQRLIHRMQVRYAGQPEQIDAALVRRGGTSGWALFLALLLMAAIQLLSAA